MNRRENAMRNVFAASVAVNIALLPIAAYGLMNLLVVEPSRRLAAHEGVKALIRGENLCAEYPDSCGVVIEKNRGIAESILFETLDYSDKSPEWEYTPIQR